MLCARWHLTTHTSVHALMPCAAGVLSAGLQEALGMSDGAPPPWLVNMQRWVGAAHGFGSVHRALVLVGLHAGWVVLGSRCLHAHSEHELMVCIVSPVS